MLLEKMKRLLKILSVVLIFAMVLGGLKLTVFQSTVFGEKGGGEPVHFELPDKIILLDHGTQKLIAKTDKLFRDIIDLSDARFMASMDYYDLTISNSEMNKIEKEEMVIEFIYQSSQKTKYMDFNNNVQEREYKRLVMPLSGDYKRMVFFDNDEGKYRSPGVLTAPYDLIKRLITQ